MSSDSIEESITHWEELAKEQDRWADYQRRRGENDCVAIAKARMYRDTVKALRLEQSTGTPHCVCHLAPLKEDANAHRRSSL